MPWSSGGYEHTKGRALCCEGHSLWLQLRCKSCRFKVQVRQLACRIGGRLTISPLGTHQWKAREWCEMEQTLSTAQKALKINVDLKKFGTFAEIGAGQEAARWFFHVGRAAGTVAKSISAYDMAVSDSLYGATDRYVSRSRLEAMLTTEFTQLQNQHSDRASEHNALFVFADTVATQSLTRHKRGQGWMGIRLGAALLHLRQEHDLSIG